MSGSKLNETVRSYKTSALKARNIPNFTFVWFTVGTDGTQQDITWKRPLMR